jgi:hypothetical protein
MYVSLFCVNAGSAVCTNHFISIFFGPQTFSFTSDFRIQFQTIKTLMGKLTSRISDMFRSLILSLVVLIFVILASWIFLPQRVYLQEYSHFDLLVAVS